MMNRLWNPAAWLAILAVITMSCSTTINVIPQDYSRIDPSNMFRIITVDDHTYEATNLVIKDDVATFISDKQAMTMPVEQIRLIQQVNDNEILTGTIVIGLALVMVGGIFLLLNAD
jgi:hypothetical protein